MAQPNSRQTLIDYCLRKLGAPVIDINVDPDQLEDCVDDALQVFQEYHSEATKRIYLKHQVTATDVTNKWIPISDDVQYLTQLLPLAQGTLGAGSGMFSVRYQIALNDIANMQNFIGNLEYYSQIGQYLNTLDMILNGTPQVTFSRNEGRLYIHGEWWDNEISAGDWLVAEAYQIVDPDTFTSIYNNKFLKRYTAALIKQRWGNNLKKFEGMQLPGGVTLNGQVIYDEATEELAMAEEKMRLEQEPMPDFFIG